MDERLKVIARLLDGEKMAQLCREFGVSRKPSSGGLGIGVVADFELSRTRASKRSASPTPPFKPNTG